MGNLILKIFILLFGIFLVVKYNEIGINTAKFRENFLKGFLFDVKYSKRDIQITQFMFLGMGILFTVLGTLFLSGVIKTR